MTPKLDLLNGIEIMLAQNLVTFICVVCVLLAVIGYCGVWSQNKINEMQHRINQLEFKLRKSEEARINLLKQLDAYRHVGYSLRAVSDELRVQSESGR